jgi:hypothetical protein
MFTCWLLLPCLDLTHMPAACQIKVYSICADRLACSCCAAQPWYAALESIRYLLPEDDATDKLTGQSWQVGRAGWAACFLHPLLICWH